MNIMKNKHWPLQVQYKYRFLIPVLNAQAAQALHTIAAQFSWYGSDHRALMSQLNVALIHSYMFHQYALLIFILICYPWTCVQPDSARRLVDWCRN